MSFITRYDAICAKVKTVIAGANDLQREADRMKEELLGTGTKKPAAAATARPRGRPPRTAATAATTRAAVKLTPKEVPAWLAANYPEGLPEAQLATATGMSPLQLANFKRMIAKSGAVVIENGICRCPPGLSHGAPPQQAA